MLEYWTFSKEDFPSVQIQVERADTWLGRFCGLMMRKPLPHGSGLLLVSTNSIHMCFMRFAIDAVYINRDYEILKVVSGLRPWLGVSWCPIAWAVIELKNGEAIKYGLAVGERLNRPR